MIFCQLLNKIKNQKDNIFINISNISNMFFTKIRVFDSWFNITFVFIKIWRFFQVFTNLKSACFFSGFYVSTGIVGLIFFLPKKSDLFFWVMFFFRISISIIQRKTRLLTSFFLLHENPNLWQFKESLPNPHL